MAFESSDKTNDEILGPAPVDIVQVGLTFIGTIVSGFVGSIVIIVSVYYFLQYALEVTGVYAFVYAITGFFSTLIATGLDLLMNKIINPDKYQRSMIVFKQIFLFYIFLFIFALPTYIFIGATDTENIVYVFSLNLVISILAASLFEEIISSYRYVLLGIYGSFLGALVAILLTLFLFVTFSSSLKNLFILVGLLILINTTIISFRALFNYLYYLYYSKSGMDQLGDIYYQIESEEKEAVDQARRENEKFGNEYQ